MNTKTFVSQKGLTLIKSMILTVAVAACVWLLVASNAESRRSHNRSGRISCINNEKQIGIAFRGVGIDIGGFPMGVARASETEKLAEVAVVEPAAGEEELLEIP